MPLHFSPRIPFIGILGSTGFVAGTACSLIIAWQANLDLLPYFLIAGTLFLAFFLSAFITKIITGNESYVLYRYLLLSIVLTISVCLFMKEPVLRGLDIFITGFGTFHFFGRIGCFLGGCCHGRLSHTGVRYGEPYAQTSFPRYFINRKILPVQLIEAGIIAAITITCFFIRMQKPEAGSIFCTYMIAYALARYTIEFLRGDTDRPFGLGFSEAQWTSAFIVLIISACEWFDILPFAAGQQAGAFLLLLSMTTVYFLRKKFPEWDLRNPRHVDELITAAEKGISDNTRNDQMPVGRTTSQDIHMSFSTLYEHERTGFHLAFSVRKEYRRTERIKEAFRIIQETKFESCEHKLIADRNGVIHFQVYTDKIISNDKK